MSKAARSVYLFSFYLMVVGAALTIVPNSVLGMLSQPQTEEPWLRITGMFAFILGFYYFKSAKNELKLFFQWTVYGRLAGLIMFCNLGISGFGPPILVLFGVVDGVTALHTHHCLKVAEDSKSGVAKDSQ